MQQSIIFNNLKDLAEYWGCDPTEESLSRAVYKGTECGAWLKVETQILVQKPQRWVALIASTSSGVRVDLAKQIKSILDIGNHRDWLSIEQAPEQVKLFLGLGENNIMEGIHNYDHLAELVKSDHLKDNDVRLKLTQLSFKVNIPEQEDKPGITIGSIVEGSDADCTPFTLYFPFTSQELEDNLRELEDQANEMWHEANNWQEEE